MSLLGFQTLRCPDCDKSTVIPIGELVWREGMGQAFRALGHYCFTCSKPFNAEGAIKVLRQKELREKIKELEVSSGR